MTWQPPPPPPRPGQGGGYGRPQGQGPGPAGGGPDGASQDNRADHSAKDFASMNYYQLLQVNREAHSTIIRYAYRFLAAMYHPDNAETGNADKFRIVTEAWRTLSDEGKRAAYDMSLGAQEESSGSARPQQSQKRDKGLPKIQKTGVSWDEIELRLAILQILLDQRKKRPKTGGASAKMIMDVLDLQNLEETEFALWYLREKGFIEMGERLFMITAKGVDYIVDTLQKPTMMGETATEKKVKTVVDGGVPAVLPR